MRLHRIGECRAKTVLVPFAKTKGTRAKRESFKTFWSIYEMRRMN